MSTYWGYCCEDCKVETDKWVNRGQEVLNEYADLTLLIDKFNVKMHHTEIVPSGCNWAVGEASDFLNKHKGHNIVLKNEYGDIEKLNTPTFLRLDDKL